MSENLLLIFFNIFILLMLALDLGVIQRRAHFPTMREALSWTFVWVSLAVLFGLYIWHDLGSSKALEFYTGYVIEEALSVDNVFVFIVIFSYFAVPKNAQHKVLFWGVISAIILRALFIVAGAALISKFHWILYLLGIFLIFTAIKLAVQKGTEVHPEHNPFIKLARKLFPVTKDYVGEKFFIRHNSKRYITPLFLVLLMIESTDIAFATDSIPAIFAITRDTFIIYTSNIFAILGLRSLYFVVAGFMKQFRFLKYGLSIVLGFIGVKMLIEPVYKIQILLSLGVIFSIITLSIFISVIYQNKSDNLKARDT